MGQAQAAQQAAQTAKDSVTWFRLKTDGTLVKVVTSTDAAGKTTPKGVFDQHGNHVNLPDGLTFDGKNLLYEKTKAVYADFVPQPKPAPQFFPANGKPEQISIFRDDDGSLVQLIQQPDGKFRPGGDVLKNNGKYYMEQIDGSSYQEIDVVSGFKNSVGPDGKPSLQQFYTKPTDPSTGAATESKTEAPASAESATASPAQAAGSTSSGTPAAAAGTGATMKMTSTEIKFLDAQGPLPEITIAKHPDGSYTSIKVTEDGIKGMGGEVIRNPANGQYYRETLDGFEPVKIKAAYKDPGNDQPYQQLDLSKGETDSKPTGSTKSPSGPSVNIQQSIDNLSQRNIELDALIQSPNISDKAKLAYFKELEGNQKKIQGLKKDTDKPKGSPTEEKKKGPIDHLLENPVFLGATAIMGGWGLYAGMSAAMTPGHKFSVGDGFQLFSGFIAFFAATAKFLQPYLQGHAGLTALAASAIIMGVAAYVARHGKKQNREFNGQLDPAAINVGPQAAGAPTTASTASTASKPWYRYLSDNAPVTNVLFLASTAAAIGAWINLSAGSPAQQITTIESTQLPAVSGALSSQLKTGQVMPESPIGRTFVKLGNPTTPDQTVTVMRAPGSKDKIMVMKTSLNPEGKMVGEGPLSMLPFYMVEPKTGYITPNPAAVTDLEFQAAMTQTANSGVSPVSANTAIDLGAARGYRVNYEGARP